MITADRERLRAAIVAVAPGSVRFVEGRNAPSAKTGPHGAITFRVWGTYVVYAPARPLTATEADRLAAVRRDWGAEAGLSILSSPRGGWPYAAEEDTATGPQGGVSLP